MAILNATHMQGVILLITVVIFIYDLNVKETQLLKLSSTIYG